MARRSQSRRLGAATAAAVAVATGALLFLLEQAPQAQAFITPAPAAAAGRSTAAPRQRLHAGVHGDRSNRWMDQLKPKHGRNGPTPLCPTPFPRSTHRTAPQSRPSSRETRSSRSGGSRTTGGGRRTGCTWTDWRCRSCRTPSTTRCRWRWTARGGPSRAARSACASTSTPPRGT